MIYSPSLHYYKLHICTPTLSLILSPSSHFIHITLDVYSVVQGIEENFQLTVEGGYKLPLPMPSIIYGIVCKLCILCVAQTYIREFTLRTAVILFHSRGGRRLYSMNWWPKGLVHCLWALREHTPNTMHHTRSTSAVISSAVANLWCFMYLHLCAAAQFNCFLLFLLILLNSF